MSKNNRRSWGEGSFYQLKNGNWRLRFRCQGKSRDVTAPTKMAALQKKTIYLKTHPQNRGTVAEHFSWWLQNVKAIELKPTSYDRLESTVKNHIISNVGSFAFCELSPQLIETRIISVLIGLGKSYSSVIKVKNALNACYEYFIGLYLQRDIVIRNPVKSLKVTSNEIGGKPKKIQPLTQMEIDLFKEACTARWGNDKPIYHLGYGYIFLLNTGVRLGEALSLKWSDIDFNRRTLTISKNLVMAIDRSWDDEEDEIKTKYVPHIQNSTKTDAGERKIPLNDAAVNALLMLKEIRYFGQDSHVLSTVNNTYNKPRNFCRAFDEILVRAGIEHRGIHSLRHTFATMQFLAGVEIGKLSKMLGHTSVQITYDIYIDVINMLGCAKNNMVHIQEV